MYVYVLFGLLSSNNSLLPSGKHLHNAGKSRRVMCKSTISMVIFDSYVELPEGSQWFMIWLLHFLIPLNG